MKVLLPRKPFKDSGGLASRLGTTCTPHVKTHSLDERRSSEQRLILTGIYLI